MRALMLTAAALLVATAAFAGSTAMNFHVGGGLALPMGDYADYAKTGWQGLAGVGIKGESWPVAVRIDAVYGKNSHEGTMGDATNLYGVLGRLVYPIKTEGKAKPYIMGTFGVLNHHYSPGTTEYMSEDEWKPAFGGGAGIGFKAGEKMSVFIESGFFDRDGTAVVPVTAGVRFAGK